MGAFQISRRAAFLALVTLAASANAQTTPNTLRLGTGGAFSSIDPHYHNIGSNNVIADHIFDTLVEFDPKYRPVPGLAVSWTAIDPHIWEFKLRDGVTFQDGSPFTADDVVFTFARVPEVLNSPSSFVFATKPVTRMEVVDPHTVRMIFADPAPLYPVIVPAVRIVSRKNGEGATTADYNSGKAAIGTGPYKLVSAMLGDRVELKRNETGWAKKPAYETVIYRMIPNSAARIAALRSGDVDAIDAVPPRDVATIKADPNIQILSQASQRLIYLAPDVSREITPFITDLDGKPIPNPLRDVRVRRALSLAINRDGIRDRIMDGFAVPTGQIMPEGTSGYDPSIKPDPFNLAEAKKLLAEAGYPNGFAMTLHGPNDRYVNDGAIVEAIAQMWTRLGLKITVNTMPTSVFFSAAGRDEFSMRLTGWASDTGEASSNLITLVASSNPDKGRDRTLLKSKYANPKADALVEKAIATADDAEREALYREATRLGMAELSIIPIHNQVNVWAVRKGITFHPRIAEGMRAVDFEPTK